MPDLVFVTGATGYIAKHLVFQLLEKGYAVRGSMRSLASETGLRDDLRGAGLPAETVARNLACVALDLENDAGWDEAMQGATALMHTASPFPLANPKREDDLIRPAVDGTLRALHAAQTAGINRVILTSSTAAIVSFPQKPGSAVFDETDWARVRDAAAYPKSKTMAERAAWDFVASDAPEMSLTTINPGLVLGPPIGRRFGASLSLVERGLAGKDPMLPDIGFACVDVRDVAAAHIAALERPQAGGERYACTGGYLTFPEFAQVLKDQYPDRKIPLRVAPNFVMRLLGLFDPAIRGIVPSLGQRTEVSSKKAQAQLGLTFRDIRDSLRSTAAFLVETTGK